MYRMYKRERRISPYIYKISSRSFQSLYKRKKRRNLRKDENTIRLIIERYTEFFMPNRKSTQTSSRGRRVKSIKRGVHILTRKKERL